MSHRSRITALEASLPKSKPMTKEELVRKEVDLMEADPECAPLRERFRTVRQAHGRRTLEEIEQDPELMELLRGMRRIVRGKHPELGQWIRGEGSGNGGQ